MSDAACSRVFIPEWGLVVAGPSRCNYYKINMLPAAQIDHNYAPLFLLRLLIISFVLLFNSLPCNIFISGYMQSYLLSGENQLF